MHLINVKSSNHVRDRGQDSYGGTFTVSDGTFHPGEVGLLLVDKNPYGIFQVTKVLEDREGYRITYRNVNISLDSRTKQMIRDLYLKMASASGEISNRPTPTYSESAGVGYSSTMDPATTMAMGLDMSADQVAERSRRIRHSPSLLEMMGEDDDDDY